MILEKNRYLLLRDVNKNYTTPPLFNEHENIRGPHTYK